MESAQDAAGGTDMIVLHEDVRNPASPKSGLPKGLGEEAPGVSVPRLLDQDEAWELKLDEAERHGAGK
jgi:hypothetical protein